MNTRDSCLCAGAGGIIPLDCSLLRVMRVNVMRGSPSPSNTQDYTAYDRPSGCYVYPCTTLRIKIAGLPQMRASLIVYSFEGVCLTHVILAPGACGRGPAAGPAALNSARRDRFLFWGALGVGMRWVRVS